MTKKNHPLYVVWRNMMLRCYKSSDKSFAGYGGRGIRVADEWHNFERFVADMMPSYVKGLTLERKKNHENYSPGNCKWATPKEQANNRRSNRVLEFLGESHNLEGWSQKTGIKLKTLHMRLAYGWSIERVLSAPVRDWSPGRSLSKTASRAR